MIKAEFSASLLQSSMSHDPSEIILISFAAQEKFLSIIAASYLCGNRDVFFQLILYITMICNVIIYQCFLKIYICF